MPTYRFYNKRTKKEYSKSKYSFEKLLTDLNLCEIIDSIHSEYDNP